MPPPSNSERIHDNTEAIRKLEQSVATLDERLESVRGEVASLSNDLELGKRNAESMRDRIASLSTEFARLDERLKTIHEHLQKQERRRWAVFLAIFTAILSLAVSITVLVVQRVV